MNLYRLYREIKEFPQNLRYRHQRAKRGYSNPDSWNIYSWFMEIMPRILADFKKNLHGCPAHFAKQEDGTEDVEQGMKAWEAVIERMIFCFTEMNEDTGSMKNEFADEYHRQLHKPNEGKPVKEWFEPDDEHPDYYRLIEGEVDPELKENFWNREKEISEYRDQMKDEGLELFKQYFWNLWD